MHHVVMLSVLPKDIQLEIVQYLDAESCLAIWKTNRLWKELVEVRFELINLTNQILQKDVKTKIRILLHLCQKSCTRCRRNPYLLPSSYLKKHFAYLHRNPENHIIDSVFLNAIKSTNYFTHFPDKGIRF